MFPTVTCSAQVRERLFSWWSGPSERDLRLGQTCTSRVCRGLQPPSPVASGPCSRSARADVTQVRGQR